jgi:ribosomal protein S8
MSTKPSEQMMDLLKELAFLKDLDAKHETTSPVDTTDLESRKNRRHEICEQIKALGGPIG